jgi:xylulokinase
MQEDNLTINVIRAGNDNLFRSSLFSTTVASLLGQPIEIFDTTGAIGAARAAGIENKNLELFSAQLASLDKVAEIQPIASNEPYVIAYNHWKKTLETNLNNLKH